MSGATISSGISDFQLTTANGQPITNRVPCYDDVVATWTVLNSDCSDSANVGYISLSTSDGTWEFKHILTALESNCTLRFPCNSDTQSGPYVLNFHRQCSDVSSDDRSINIDRFKTTVDAGPDQIISFGATVALGSGTPDPMTVYSWTSANISDVNSLNTTDRPCVPGLQTYTITAYDFEFSDSSASDFSTVTVATPVIMWSDILQSDDAQTCTFSAWLISSDTYTNNFEITLQNLTTGSDLVRITSDAPCFFTYTAQKPTLPGKTQYTLSATLSDCAGCPGASVSTDFFCTRPPVTPPASGPTMLEMMIRLFGFLFLFIFFGLTFA